MDEQQCGVRDRRPVGHAAEYRKLAPCLRTTAWGAPRPMADTSRRRVQFRHEQVSRVTTENQPAKPVVEGLFTPRGADGRVHLLCSRCACGALAFPQRQRCAACSGTELTVVEAPAEGVIYSWTTAPGGNPPRVVAQVLLGNGLMVQGCVAAEPGAVQIDQAVRTCLVPAGYGDDGEPLVSYAFESVPGGG